MRLLDLRWSLEKGGIKTNAAYVDGLSRCIGALLQSFGLRLGFLGSFVLILARVRNFRTPTGPPSDIFAPLVLLDEVLVDVDVVTLLVVISSQPGPNNPAGPPSQSGSVGQSVAHPVPHRSPGDLVNVSRPWIAFAFAFAYPLIGCY